MKSHSLLPTPDGLRLVIRYDAETGALYWLKRARAMFPDDGHWKTWNKRFAGKEALTALANAKNHYRHGHVFGVKLKAHRVIWAIVHGAWPDGEIDHINGDTLDNRIVNLRLVSRGENCRNLAIPKNNTSGVIGVSWDQRKHRWLAQIWERGRPKHIGRFNNFADAVQARREAEHSLGYHVNHGMRVRGGGSR